jgi:hypothetical protein
MTTYFITGLEISAVVSLTAGLTIGAAWGIAGLTSAWLFFAEMLSVLGGGLVILSIQLLLAAMTTASLGPRSGALLCASFLIVEPAFALLSMCTAIAAAYLLGRIRSQSHIF